MASQMLASFEVTLFRGFNLIRCNRLCFAKPNWSIQDYAGINRVLSTSTCQGGKKSDDTSSFEVKEQLKQLQSEGSETESRQRVDLERLKLLLKPNKSPIVDPNTPQVNNREKVKASVKALEQREGSETESRQRVDLESSKLLLKQEKSPIVDPKTSQVNRKRAKESQTKKIQNTSVNISKFKNILSSFTSKVQKTQFVPPSIEIPSKEMPSKEMPSKEMPSKEMPSKESGLKHEPLIPVSGASDTIQGESRKVTKSMVKADKQLASVKASKIKDALSILGQDRSSTPAEDIVLAGGRLHKSPERLLEMEGILTMKQHQFRDKDIRSRIQRNSLSKGKRLHWFDEAKTKWSGGAPSTEPTLFQEMAEMEVRDTGTSAGVQSGFHDLIENINRQWSFPIDNEICKTEEENVGFDQHVFLEYALDEFQQTGNIRQFMELVVTGLQQNPHLNVNEKNEHIIWFKEYFENMPDELVQL